MTISSREESWQVGIRERSLGTAGWTKDSRRPGWDLGSSHGGQTDLGRLFLEGLAGLETLGGSGLSPGPRAGGYSLEQWLPEWKEAGCFEKRGALVMGEMWEWVLGRCC